MHMIAIIGAGLTGLMCAIRLAQRGFDVQLFEKRSENELNASKNNAYLQTGRSMSMDISARGIFALKGAGLFDEISQRCVPMKFKITHDKNYKQSIIPYGPKDNDVILTISRSSIFHALFKQCQNFSNITISFSHQLIDINVKNKTIIVNDAQTGLTKSIHPQVIIGADGVNSFTRKILENQLDAGFSISDFPMSYKEIRIPAHHNNILLLNAMHLWPRKHTMLVAQPNFDTSFTCALLMHEHDHEPCFSSINSPKKIRELFSSYFSDISELVPDLEDQYMKNPIGKLKIISGTQWGFDNFVLIIGDAAHGMVPFFGQGVNCSFEDCTFLASELDRTKNDWKQVFDAFNLIRVQEAQAINALSYENYPELFENCDFARSHLLKEIDSLLSSNYRETYRSYHNLVCFERVPYTFAQKIKSIQMPLLERLSAHIDDIKQIDKAALESEMANYKRMLINLTKEKS
jgi:kynurenine 3-monooxygenase